MPDCLLQNGHTYRSKDGHLCQPQHLSAQVHTIASKSAAMRATSMLRHLTSSIFFLAAYCLLVRRPAVWYKQSCSSSRHQRLSLPVTLPESSLHRYTWCTNNMAVSMCHAASVCRTGGEAAEGHRSLHLLCHGFLLSCRGSCCAGAATEGVPTTSCIIV